MSELFDRIFDSGCSGCIRVCECSVTHFDRYNIWDWNDGELENLEINAKQDPKGFIGHNHAIGTISIAGIEIVIGCTCDIAQKYENFIIVHDKKIAEYLNERAETLEKRAKGKMKETAKTELKKFRETTEFLSQKVRLTRVPFDLNIIIYLFKTDDINMPPENFTKRDDNIRSGNVRLPCLLFGNHLTLKIIDELLE